MEYKQETIHDLNKELVGSECYFYCLNNLLGGFSSGRIFKKVSEEDWLNICSGISFRVNQLYSQYENSKSIDITNSLLVSMDDYMDKWEMYDKLFDKRDFGDGE